MKRNYNEELKDDLNYKYKYNFDIQVMHKYIIKSFVPFFIPGDVLELGSSYGDFTSRLLPFFNDITCVEASLDAIKIAKHHKMPVTIIHSLFDDVKLHKKYKNIIVTHVLEHINDRIALLKKIKDEWLSDDGRLFIVVPNANAASRQIAVNMGVITHNSAITDAESKHGHQITYSLDTLQYDVTSSGLKIEHSSGIFFKAFANFQWDMILNTDIISEEYLDGCYKLGFKYPDLCSSIFIVCKT